MTVKKQKTVTVGIFHNDKVLLLKRGETAPWQPNKYCLPGGGLDKDESLISGAIRETLEETNLSITREELRRLIIPYKNGRKSIVYVTKIHDPVVTLNYEHSEYVWLSYQECGSYYHNKLFVPYLISKLSYFRKRRYF